MRATPIAVGLAAMLVVAGSGPASAAWTTGFYKGYGKAGNVCIAFEVRGKKVVRLRVKGSAEECGHRYRCSGRLTRSAPGGTARDIRIERSGRFEAILDVTLPPPRPGPPARRIAMTIAGTLKGRKAKGTFRVLFDAGGGNRCDSGVLHWTARRVKRDPGIDVGVDPGGDRDAPPRREPPPPAEDPLEPLVP
jgi:hypothetical protein